MDILMREYYKLRIMKKGILVVLNKSNDSLYYSNEISNDIQSIKNSINNNLTKNHFLFIGEDGTGKKEVVKFIANDLDRKVYAINYKFLEAKTVLGKFRKLNILFKVMLSTTLELSLSVELLSVPIRKSQADSVPTLIESANNAISNFLFFILYPLLNYF